MLNSLRAGSALLLECRSAGPCALWHGQPGQVGNEAATAISRKCRRQGSPLILFSPGLGPSPASPELHRHAISFLLAASCFCILLPPGIIVRAKLRGEPCD